MVNLRRPSTVIGPLVVSVVFFSAGLLAADEARGSSDVSLKPSSQEQESEETSDEKTRKKVKRSRGRTGAETPPPPEQGTAAEKKIVRTSHVRSAGTRVQMAPASAEYATGDRVTLHVRILNGKDVGSVPFHVVYDPQVLVFEGGVEEAFLGSDGRETAFFAAPTSSGDRVVVGLSRLGRGDGIAGTGELCVLHFTAIAPGDAGLAFERAKIRDSSNGVVGASFEVRPVTVR
jgi:hypothetical protein